MLRKFIFFTALLFYVSSFAQTDVINNCINLFNQGNYQACAAAISSALPSLPFASQGVLKYFLAESYYNLALAENNSAAALSHFKNANVKFGECLTHPDLQVSEYREQARYKKGWAQFRLAELGDSNIGDHFRGAYQSFLEVDSRAADNLYLFSSYMAGEAKLAQMIYEQQIYISANAQAAQINTLIGGLNDAQRKYAQAASDAGAPFEVKIAAQIRRADIYFQMGRIYQSIPTEIFGALNDANRQGSLEESVQYYFRQADYQGLQNQLPADKRDQIGPILTYSEVLKQVFLYITTKDNQLYIENTNRLLQLPENNYAAERLFRQGNQDQALTLRNQSGQIDERWNNLAHPTNSFYNRAGSAIPESFLWHGIVQTVLSNAADARNSYNKLADLSGASATPRRRLLAEEATFRKFGLRFEEIMRLANLQQKMSQLNALDGELNGFAPQSIRLQTAKTKLSRKIRIARLVASNNDAIMILGQILSILENDTRLALEYVKELLPQAAAVVHLDRKAYLRIIDVLLLSTIEHYGNASLFYQGISTSLNAEVQPSAQERSAKFREAAQKLAEVQGNISSSDPGNYKGEAEYVRARALFFAGENEAAKTIFINLVNNRASLRALFYLAEIYRTTNKGVAAKRCFEEIQNKTRGNPSASFWYNNAVAGFNRSGNDGSLDDLRGVNISTVRFPDVLSRDADGKAVQYEYLADTEYLQQQKAEEALKLLIQFGLPKRSLYPSVNLLKNSQIAAEGIFNEFTSPINDRRGAAAAGLKLIVLSEVGEPLTAFRVSFGQESLQANSEGWYVRDQIDLNLAVTIAVQSAGYYPFIKDHVFKTPQVDTLRITPSKTLTLTVASGSIEAPGAESFTNRFDQNLILQPKGKRIPQESAVFKELDSNPYLRDYVFHPTLNAFLVVDANANKIRRVENTDQAIASSVEFIVAFENSTDALNSPEGIAVDSDGLIYIADWGNHRIVVAKMNGEVVRIIGGFGLNTSTGDAAKFVFPTRIAVAEDGTGVIYNGKTVLREKMLFVADRNGVHLLDERGHYFDTVVKPSSRFPKASFYAIAAEGFGATLRLFVADRQKKEVVVFQQR